MVYCRPQQAMAPAVRALGPRSIRLRGYATLALRSTRSAGPSTGSSPGQATLSICRSSPPRYPRVFIQTRAKGYWHRPGCSWATATTNGDAKSAPRDKDCPACQHEDSQTSEPFAADSMWQHKRRMIEMRRMLENDPYEAMFGWSNRRVGSLWGRHSPFPEVKQTTTQSRATVHSTASSHVSASFSSRVRGAGDTAPAPKKSDPQGQHDLKASVTWSTSGVDENGKPFGESGSLVYDPVSGRMVPTSSEEVSHVSTNPAPATVVGKVVHAKLVEEAGSPEIKYARPSADPDTVPDESISRSLQQKMQQIKRTEEKLEAAKDRADSAIGVEQDARRYGFTDPSAKDSIEPSGETPVNIQNPMARLVHVELNEDGPADKYITPSSDAPPSTTNERLGSSAKATMEQVMQRERDLAEAKKHATSAVGVEEDAARAGWTSDDKPSRTVSNFDDFNRFKSGHGTNPVSNLRHPDRSNKVPGAAAPSSSGDGPAVAQPTYMDRIRAKEREIEEAKRNLNTLKVKQHEMERSWHQEQGQSGSFDGGVRSAHKWPTQHELDQQARLREQRREGSNAWARFKNATPSKGYLTLQENDSARELEAPLQPSPIAPRLEADRRDSSAAARADRPAKLSPSWRAAASSEQPIRGIMKDRSAGALSVFTKDRPVRDMSFDEARNARQSWLQSLRLDRSKASGPRPSTPAETLLRDEVSKQRSAMAAFENKWGHRPAQQPGPATDGAVKTPEFVTGEGDMAPNVADFATAERWYKNKAPHAIGSEQQRFRDAELVAAVRGIYERAYGTINATHKQSQGVQDEAKARKPESAEQRHTGTKLGDFELRAYSRHGPGNGEISSLAPAKVSLLRLQQHADKPVMQLASALSQLRGSSAFADFLLRNNKLKEQIVFAEGDLLVTRVPVAESGAADVKVGESRPSAETPASPDLSPPMGNFASPTGFVNHDVFVARSKKTNRKVRKEEPVFSGAIPAQKYSVPEIVQMLNKKGVSGGSNAEPGSSDPPRSGKGYERHQRRLHRRFARLVKRMLLVGTWIAACCYATGVMIEYFRTGPAHASDDPTASWEDRGFRRMSNGGLFGGSNSKEGEAQERSAAEQQRRKRAEYFSDMPLKGFEYPLLGVLAACIWYLISTGQ